MRRSIGIQFYLILGNVFLIVLATGIVGIIWANAQEETIERVLREQLLEQARLFAALVGERLVTDAGIAQIDLPQGEAEGSNMTVVFVSLDKTPSNLTDLPLSTANRSYIIAYSQSALNGQATTADIYGSNKKTESIYSAVPVQDSSGRIVGALCLIVPIDSLELDFAHLRTTLYEAITLAALAGIVFSFILAFAISRRVTDAKRLAEMVADGNYQLRLPEKGPSEFKELAHYLNRMAEELEDQTKQRQTLLSNVTHELARPLGGLQVGIESLQSGAINDPSLASDLLNSMASTIQRMEGLLDDITLAAYPKTRPVELRIGRVDLERLLLDLVARSRPRAARQATEIILELPEKLPAIYADEKRLYQIMGNLIDNALKYTMRGKQITISAKLPGNNSIQLKVHDGGNGISTADAPYIFSPFYQGASGKLIRQGMGLGLAIARQLAEIHGGSLELVNHPDGGAVATLTLPIRP